MKNLSRTVWVGYSVANGFMKGRTYPEWTDDFSKARLYSRRADVLSSARKRRGTNHYEVTPIAIELNLEEEVAMIMKLGGIPQQE